MAAYYMNELGFELPDLGFLDRTVIDIDAELPGGDMLGLLVVREPLPPDKTLRAAVDEHLLREATRLGGYAVLGNREATIGGAPAIEVSTRWRNGRAAFYTREAHIARPRERLVFAATGVYYARAAVDDHVNHILSTLRLRDLG